MRSKRAKDAAAHLLREPLIHVPLPRLLDWFTSRELRAIAVHGSCCCISPACKWYRGGGDAIPRRAEG
jgi:hypothetical protein